MSSQLVCTKISKNGLSSSFLSCDFLSWPFFDHPKFLNWIHFSLSYSEHCFRHNFCVVWKPLWVSSEPRQILLNIIKKLTSHYHFNDCASIYLLYGLSMTDFPETSGNLQETFVTGLYYKKPTRNLPKTYWKPRLDNPSWTDHTVEILFLVKQHLILGC